MINIPTLFNRSSGTDRINAKVELYDGSTLVTTCTCDDRLQDFVIERVGQGNKFFGFGIFHKITINFIDLERTLEIVKGNSFKVYFTYNNDFVNFYPTFYATDIRRDENNNTITVVAYDKLKYEPDRVVGEISAPYTVRTFADVAIDFLGVDGLEIIGLGESETCFDTSFPEGANFEPDDSFKQALDDVAEVTQTIYYLNYENKLVFKRLDITGDSVLTITKEDYYDFDTSDTYVLATITNTNELNDEISSTIGNGVTQYVRNNAFWELNDNISTLLDNAIAAVAGTTLTKFNIEWDGNVLLEVGDKISLIREDDTLCTSYVFMDVITYDGSLTEVTYWDAEDQNESANNPTSLGEAIKQTFAKVDKANKEITLLASDVAVDKADIASLKVTTEAITSSVSTLETTTATIENNLGALVETTTALEKTVSTKLTATDFDIKVTEKLSSGVDEIAISETGFKFDKTGLTITKTDSEMSTNVDEDGLSVYKNNEEVLTVDNAGVRAKNLHATTYLIVGNNTYFSDFISDSGEDRAGCFWTGK